MITNHPHLPGLLAMDLHRLMGVELHEAHEGHARLSFPVSEQMLTPKPALHAGFLYTAADLASYVALMSVLRADEAAVTHDLHVSVMRSAGPGDRVTVDASVVKRGRSLAFMDVRASSGETLLATARVTKSLLGS